MVSSSVEPRDAGFATPAATVVSLALGIVAAAVAASGVMELGLAKTDLRRASADYALAGAQEEAVMALLNAKQQTRLRWSQSTLAGSIFVLAEPQSAKLDLTNAAGIGDELLRQLGVIDPAQLRARLTTLAATSAPDSAIADADPAPMWRACARSVMSFYGMSTKAGVIAAVTPVAGPLDWRIGQVWRLRVVTADGWADDRILRFTGDLLHPAAVVERRLGRTNDKEGACETIFAAGPKI